MFLIRVFHFFFRRPIWMDLRLWRCEIIVYSRSQLKVFRILVEKQQEYGVNAIEVI